MAIKVMRSEERNVFLGDLMGLRLGTKEVENFISKQERLRREGNDGGLGEYDSVSIMERERIMVANAMENKLTDSLVEGVRKKQDFFKLKQRLWWRLGRYEERRKMTNRMREEVERLRKEVRRDHKTQVREIRIETKKKIQDVSLPKELQAGRDHGPCHSPPGGEPIRCR